MKETDYAALILRERAAHANAGASIPVLMPPSEARRPPAPPRGEATGDDRLPHVSTGSGSFV